MRISVLSAICALSMSTILLAADAAKEAGSEKAKPAQSQAVEKKKSEKEAPVQKTAAKENTAETQKKSAAKKEVKAKKAVSKKTAAKKSEEKAVVKKEAEKTDKKDTKAPSKAAVKKTSARKKADAKKAETNVKKASKKAKSAVKATPVKKSAEKPKAQKAADPEKKKPITTKKAAPAPKKEAASEQNTQSSSDLKISRAIVAKNVEKHEPKGASGKFSKDAGKLVFFTHVNGAGDSTAVVHRWYHNGNAVQKTVLPVKSVSWRTYSRRTLTPEISTGKWKVEVLQAGSDEVLESKTFVVE
ncbi:MAG: DUF2914 domain-containing protein [Chitinispirillaceae bacterium]